MKLFTEHAEAIPQVPCFRAGESARSPNHVTTNLLGHKYHDHFGNLTMFQRDVRSYDKTYGMGVRYKY